MGIFEKFKNAFSLSEEGYLDDVDVEEEEEYSAPRINTPRRSRRNEVANDNVVNIHSSSEGASLHAVEAPQPHVVVVKIDSFNEVASAADVLIEQRIVILNLETCPDSDSVRVLDLLAGITYANGGSIRRIAGRAYVAVPNSIPISGELLDEVVSAAARNNGIF